jgi:hypothetical protein
MVLLFERKARDAFGNAHSDIDVGGHLSGDSLPVTNRLCIHSRRRGEQSRG